MTEGVLTLSASWVAAIAIFEWRRTKAFLSFDFLSVTNTLFALNFAVVPLAVQLWPGYEAGVRRIFKFAEFIEVPENALETTVLAMAAQIIVIAVYYLAYRFRGAGIANNGGCTRLLQATGENGPLVAVLVAGGIGTIGLFGYATSLGGFEQMFQISAKLRNGSLVAAYGYLKIVGFLAVPAFYVALTKTCSRAESKRLLWACLATMFGAVAAVLVVHDLGRMQIAVFFLVPVLTYVVVKRIRPWVCVPAVVILGVGAFLFIRPLALALIRTIRRYEILSDRGRLYNFDLVEQFIGFFSFYLQKTQLSLGIVPDMVGSIFSEFSFPHYVFSTYLQKIPTLIAYRGLDDFFAAAVMIMPSVLVGIDPLYILDINTELFFGQPVPVDLLSLGLVAFGIGGTALFVAVYGAVLGASERFFADDRMPTAVILRMAWAFYMPFWLMYADPLNVVKRGFGLLFLFGFLVVLASSVLLWKKWFQRGGVLR